jgi:hypothetical protein
VAADAVSEHCFRRLALVLSLVLIAGCAPKLTTQQALVEEAYQACKSQGPSTRLERVERDGRFAVVGREAESRRVHDCMVRYAEPPRRAAQPGTPPAGTPVTPPPSAPPSVSAPATAQPEPVAAGRMPGTWRGTLTQAARATGEAETASPATVRFAVAGGTLRWTLTAGAGRPTVTADGTAVVVDGALRMTGTVRATARAASAEPSGSTVTVRYAGTLVGDRLDLRGVTTDKQVHVLSVRRAVE